MPPDHPLFSVIVPVFDAGAYLDRAIASVREQTWTDFELILIDDGSTDDAVDRACAIHDGRLRVIRQPNAGAPTALNRGVAVANGEYVALLDADDFWAPTKLERQRRDFLDHPEADLVFTGLVYVDAADEPLHLPPRRPAGFFAFEQLFADYVIGCSSAIAFRKSAMETVGDFDAAFPYMYDLDFVLRLARLRPDNVVGTPEPLTFYRRRSGQQTSDWRPMAHYWEKIIAKHRSAEDDDTGLVCRANLNMHRYFSYLAYERGDLAAAFSLLGTAFAIDPLRFVGDVRNWQVGIVCGVAAILPKSVHQWIESRLRGTTVLGAATQ
jgi:glycosyltransferase involved in cell wall biosynthesis